MALAFLVYFVGMVPIGEPLFFVFAKKEVEKMRLPLSGYLILISLSMGHTPAFTNVPSGARLFITQTKPVNPHKPGGPRRAEAIRLLNRAAEVFKEIMATPDKAIPDDLLDRAECVAIIPGLKKGALGFGGKYGKGVVMCRTADRHWSAPSFITVEGGSVGFQIGFSQTDVVLLVMNRKGIDKLIGDKFTLGADASVAAGPVGRTANAQTNVKLDAEILGYSRAKGLFAGVSLEGATLRQDQERIRDFYGEDVGAHAILINGTVPLPAEARPLAAALSHESPNRR